MSKNKTTGVTSPQGIIPRAIGKDGIAQRIIANAAAVAAANPNPKRKEQAEAIVKCWKTELKRLRKACRVEKAASADARAQARTRLCRELNSMPSDCRPSRSRRVFRYFVALGSKCRCTSELEQSALEEYARQQQLYDQLLGDAVHEPTRFETARCIFLNNENATALDDERAHWDLLQSKDAALRGLATNIPSLDAKIGGLAELTLLASPTGVGKTSLAIDLATQILKASPKVCVLFVELEVTKSRILHKFLSRESGVPYPRLLSPDTWSAAVNANVQQARERLKQTVYPRLRVVDRLADSCPGMLSEGIINHLVKNLLKATDTERCLVVLDSFDRTVPACTTGYGKHGFPVTNEIMEEQSDRARIDILLAAQRRTRSLATPEGFPFLVITRTRKALADDRRLSLSDVFGSVDLVHEAQCVLLMQQERGPRAPGVAPVLLDVAKVRDLGETGVVPLDFHFELSKFTTQANQADSSPSSLNTKPPRRRAGRT